MGKSATEDRASVRIAAALAVAMVASIGTARAESNGIAGYSGNPSSSHGGGGTCSSCHVGGSFSISASMSGATAVAPGSSTGFGISASGSATRFGFNASASSGTLGAGSASRVTTVGDDGIAGEATHASPQSSSSFGFTFNAPASVGTVTLYGCVNPVNNDNTSSGDGPPSCTTRSVTVNTSPNAVNDARSIDEDSGASCFSVLSNDTSGSSGNESGDSLDLFAVTSVSSGSAVAGGSPCGSNQVRYTPAANFNGTATFNYTIRDSFNSSSFDDFATVTVTVSAVNDAPTANPDTVAATEDTPATFSGLRTDDTDPEGDSLFIHSVSQGSEGASVQIVSGNVSYTPAANFCGAETFSYRVRDRSAANAVDVEISNLATVTVNVSCQPDGPVAADDSASVPRGSADQTLPVLGNDVDPDDFSFPFNTGLTVAGVSILSPALAGEQAAAGPGGIVYTPPPNFSGTRQLSYQVSDGTLTDTGLVTVTVQSGSPPVAVADGPFTVAEDSPASAPANTFAVLANDTDPDGDTLSIAVVSDVSNGTLGGDGGTELTYTPDPDFFGTDSFSYEARDSDGLPSGTLVVSIVVTGSNDAPVAAADALSVARGSSGNDLDVLVNDTDADNLSDPANTGLTVTAVEIRAGQAAVSGESAVIASGGAGVRYTPPANFSGTRLIDYTISDGTETATALLTVTVLAGSPPTAVADGPFTVAEDSLSSAPANAFTVLANDSDVDGDTLAVVIATPPANGTLTIDGTTLRYQPNADFAGTDGFVYRARDTSNLQSNDIAVVVDVTPVQDAPVAVTDALAVPRGSAGNALDVLANDSDVDNQAPPLNAGLTITAAAVQAGQPVVDGESVSIGAGNLVYTPPRDFSGTRVLTYSASDGIATANATVTVTVQSGGAPAAVQDGPFTVDEDSLASDLTNAFNVLANDTDPDGDTLTIVVTSTTASGTLSGSGGTLLTYQPDADFAGTDSFSYRVRDTQDFQSGVITVQVTVAPQADAPEAAVDSFPEAPLIFREDQGPFDLDVLANDTDVDAGDTRQVSAVTQGTLGGSVGVLGAAPGNAVRYTPDADFNGTDSFTYTVQDGGGLTDTATVTVEISPVNDAPSVTSTAVATAADAQVYSYQVAQSDVDDTVFTYALSGAPTTGTPMTISPSGLITWTPPISPSLAPYTVGPITVTVTDSGGGEGSVLNATQTFSITVDAPDADGDGMPDSYENAEGFDPADPADGGQDRDGDGRSNADEYTQGRDPDADDVAPVLEIPANLQVDSTGYLTAVDLGSASASDVRDGVLAVQGPTPAGPFRPGRHVIRYTARDRANNLTTLTQQLDVRPRVELGPDQVTGEGRTISLPVTLNGPAPRYPVTVDYTVGGSAGGGDHDASPGRLVIASGTAGLLEIAIAADGAGEADETLVLTLTAADGAVLGERLAQTTTIVERNLAPVVRLAVAQLGEPRTQVFSNQGAVTVTATAADANAGDVLSLDFTGTDAALAAPAGNAASFGFDPAGLAPGTYLVRVTVRDGDGAASTVETAIRVAASAPALSAADTDGDGLADDAEGFADADGDGAPDYLDRFADAFVVADQAGQPATSRVLEAEPGIGIRLGPAAIAAGRGGALVSAADVPADTLENVGGLFDFELYGLAPGGSASVVVPLNAALRPGAVWRKYAEATGWRDFVPDAVNRLASAAARDGTCPAPTSADYVAGLNALHACVRLTLEDGGPNDEDGELNGRIRDPGGAAVPRAAEPEPPPTGKSGGGGAPAPLLLAGLWTLALASIYRRRRRST